jgi:hypothetical protein
MSAAWLLFAASSSRQFATAYTLDQFNVADKILKSMEEDAKGLRDKLEEVYRSRCDKLTYDSCFGSNYNDCSSAFPIKQCTFSMPQCGDFPTRCDGDGGCGGDFGEFMKPDSEITPDCKGECWRCCAVTQLVIICC